MHIGGVPPTQRTPGLPLGIYTSHWQTVSSCAAGRSSYGEAACAAAYMSPDGSDYDIMGLFDV